MSIEQLLAGHTPEVRVTFHHLRQLVRQMAPEATERLDMPDRLLAYSAGPRMADLLFAIVPHRAHVNLQFADGAALPDPAGIMEGTGKRIRHVKNRSAADVERAALRDLIEAQLELRSSGR